MTETLLDETAKKIIGIIADQLGKEAEELSPENSFVEDLGADSLDMTEMVMSLEQELNMEIADEDAANLTSIKDVIDYVKSK